MLPSNNIRLNVTINKNGAPKRVLKGVKSVLEVPDEENECIKALSFHHNGHWRDIEMDDFDRITIEKYIEPGVTRK